jgi:hypothetical protein
VEAYDTQSWEFLVLQYMQIAKKKQSLGYFKENVPDRQKIARKKEVTLKMAYLKRIFNSVDF